MDNKNNVDPYAERRKAINEKFKSLPKGAGEAIGRVNHGPLSVPKKKTDKKAKK